MFELTKYPDFKLKESANNQYKVSGDYMNSADQEKLNKKFDSLADMVLELQNKAYELGRLRGRRETHDKLNVSGIRVIAKKHPEGWIGWMQNYSGRDGSQDPCNATLILDEGVEL